MFRPRFRLRSAFVLFLIAALAAGWARDRASLRESRQLEGSKFEIYTDRAAFEQRLAGAASYVDFDDVETSDTGEVAFETRRYASRGVLITGGGGQYASRSFDLPEDFAAASPPNLYAPGPVGENPGANLTDVRFSATGVPGLVCGFGVNFVDVDVPRLGASSITLFDRDGRWLITHDAFQGPNRAPIFRGIVAVDQSGTPVPTIARVRIVNGSGWPGKDVLECVALDDFVFGTPQPYSK